MGVESATYISELNPAAPPGTDAKSQGDDHLRLLKAVIKRTFPSLTDRLFGVTSKSGNYTSVLADNFKTLVFTATATLTLPDVNTLEGVYVLVVVARAAVTVQPAVGNINNVSGQALASNSIGFIVGGGGDYHMLVSSTDMSSLGRTLDSVADVASLKALLFPSSGLIGDADITPGSLSGAIQVSGAAAGTYRTPDSVQVNDKGQVVAISGLKYYDSTYGVIENKTLSTSLTSVLSVFTVDFKCVDPDGGWVVGDNISFGGSYVGYTNNTQNNPMTAATRHGFVVNNKVGQVSLHFATDGLYFFTPTGGYFKIDNTKWSVRVRGYAFQW